MSRSNPVAYCYRHGIHCVACTLLAFPVVADVRSRVADSALPMDATRQGDTIGECDQWDIEAGDVCATCGRDL